MKNVIAGVLLSAVALTAQESALSRFLVTAKKAGYASGDQSKVKKLSDGSEGVGYSEGVYSYRDRWYGGTSFSGQEVVTRAGKPVWSMNFYGSNAAGAAVPADFPKFHKAALRRVTEAAPFRGPAIYREGDFVYVNDVSGTVEEFQGVERVYHRDQEIYRLVYHGGRLQ